MTTASRQEDIFGGRPNHPSIFPNDFNSKNSIEKLAEAEARERARKVKLDDEAAELQKFRTAAPRLAKEKAAMLKSNADLIKEKELAEKEKEALQTEKLAAATEHQREINVLKHQLTQFLQDYSLMKIRLNQTDPRCNLDHSYHEKEVFIILACPPYTALDFGASNGTAPIGWAYNPSIPWQGFRLRRTTTAPGDSTLATSTWTVSSTCATDRYLGVNPGNGRVESQSGRLVGAEAQFQEWWIGLNTAKTGYMFESRPKGHLTMENPGEIKEGKAISQVSKTEAAGQIWHIILK